MTISTLIIILIVGIIFVYIFYLVGVYVKLENRRSMILSKFDEVDKQLGNKIEEVKKITDYLDNKDLEDTRVNLVNSITVNDKIKYDKILDSMLDDIDSKSKKVLEALDNISNINSKIDYAKEFYNDSLYQYNIILSTPSGKIMKSIFKYCEYNTF